MTATLLQQFIQEECTSYVRRLLLDALEASSLSDRLFEFNRFEVTILRAENMVRVEDVLDGAETGVQYISLADFASALS